MKLDEKVFYGPRGWTKQIRAAELLEITDEDECSSGDCCFWNDSFARFYHACATQIAALLDELPADNLDDRQNNAPCFGDLARACLTHPEQVTVSGYLVGSGRFDERITIDAIEISKSHIQPGSGGYEREPIGDDRMRIWRELAEYLGIQASVLNMPDEMIPTYSQAEGKLTTWWLWWD